MKKKGIGALLALSLCFSFAIPVVAAVADTNRANQTQENDVSLLAACEHTPGSYISSTWKPSSKYDPSVYCCYNVKWDTCICAECNTPYSYQTDEEDVCTHKKVSAEGDSGSAADFVCSKCGYSG